MHAWIHDAWPCLSAPRLSLALLGRSPPAPPTLSVPRLQTAVQPVLQLVKGLHAGTGPSQRRGPGHS